MAHSVTKVMHLPAWQALALEELSDSLSEETGVRVAQVAIVREALDEKLAEMGVDKRAYVKRAAELSARKTQRRKRVT